MTRQHTEHSHWEQVGQIDYRNDQNLRDHFVLLFYCWQTRSHPNWTYRRSVYFNSVTRWTSPFIRTPHSHYWTVWPSDSQPSFHGPLLVSPSSDVLYWLVHSVNVPSPNSSVQIEAKTTVTSSAAQRSIEWTIERKIIKLELKVWYGGMTLMELVIVSTALTNTKIMNNSRNPCAIKAPTTIHASGIW